MLALGFSGTKPAHMATVSAYFYRWDLACQFFTYFNMNSGEILPLMT